MIDYRSFLNLTVDAPMASLAMILIKWSQLTGVKFCVGATDPLLVFAFIYLKGTHVSRLLKRQI